MRSSQPEAKIVIAKRRDLAPVPGTEFFVDREKMFQEIIKRYFAFICIKYCIGGIDIGIEATHS